MNLKTAKIIFWTTTVLIFLLEGVVPALTSQSGMAKEGLKHLGYPEYLGMLLLPFKVLGALALVLPQVSGRIKEWAYAGFAIDFLGAFGSHLAVDGLGGDAVAPLVALAVLVASYISYHKIKTLQLAT